jgi:hypothetical protein
MRFRTLAFLAITVTALATPAVASAADRFAEPGGNGMEPCLQVDPCSIGAAVSAAASGDDVTLLGGVPPNPSYTLIAPLTVPANVTVHGTPGARPHVESTANAGPSFHVAGAAVLRDVSVNHTDSSNTAVNVDGGTIERVFAHSNGHWGCTAAPGSLIRDSVCWVTSALPLQGAGLEAYSGAPGAATVTIRNVTAIDTAGTAAGLKIQVFHPTADLTVNATNVIADTTVGPDVNSLVNPCCVTATGRIALDHSNYDSELENGTITITDPGSGTNQTAEPDFVDAGAGDFRQAATSTGTIDRGVAGVVNGVGLGAFDLDGLGRLQGPNPDIGAYEFPPPPTTEVTPAQVTPPPGETGQRAKALKKCKKIKSKAKKRKCKKKARKLPV